MMCCVCITFVSGAYHFVGGIAIYVTQGLVCRDFF
jgi:hypothetical protein